jgi:cAMP-dependent protein kinase regulator
LLELAFETRGSTEVFITTNNGTKEVGTMSAGDTFGEMALMYSSVRAASVRATSNLTCWALDRKHFFQVPVDENHIK